MTPARDPKQIFFKSIWKPFWESASLRRNLGGIWISWGASGGNLGSGKHLGSIWEASGWHLGIWDLRSIWKDLGCIWEPSTKHVGSIWQTSGEHLGIWDLGNIWEASERHLWASLGIWDLGSIWEASGKHQGSISGIWGASGKHLGSIFGKRLGSIWEASGKHLGSIWEASGKHLGGI